MKLIVSVILVAVISFPTYGQNPFGYLEVAPEGWKFALKSNEGNIIFIHSASIVRDGNAVELWELTDYNDQQETSDGKKYYSEKYLIRYDCKKNTSQLKHHSTYSEPLGKGETIHRYESDSIKPSYAIPDTVGYELLQVACKKSR